MALALPCIVVFGLMIVLLGLNCSMHRLRKAPEHALHNAVRSHGNTAEFVPMFSVLMFYVYLRNNKSLIFDVLMLGVTVSRIAIAYGILHAKPDVPGKPQRRNQPRFWGATGTYVFGLFLCVAVLVNEYGVALP